MSYETVKHLWQRERVVAYLATFTFARRVVVKPSPPNSTRPPPAAQLTYDIIATVRLTYHDFKAKPDVVAHGLYPYVV